MKLVSNKRQTLMCLDSSSVRIVRISLSCSSAVKFLITSTILVAMFINASICIMSANTHTHTHANIHFLSLCVSLCLCVTLCLSVALCLSVSFCLSLYFSLSLCP